MALRGQVFFTGGLGITGCYSITLPLPIIFMLPAVALAGKYLEFFPDTG
jgi:hypothetical protein